MMTLREIKYYYPRAIIVTHTDLDGYGAGSIAYKCLNLIGYDREDVVVLHKEPSERWFPELYELNGPTLIIITDLGLSNPKNTELMVDSMHQDLMVWYFDHHQSTLDVMKNVNYLSNIIGIRRTEVCATVLMWIFFQELYCAWVRNTDYRIDYFFSYIHQYSNGTLSLPTKDLRMDVDGISGPFLLKQFAQDTGVERTPNTILWTNDYDLFKKEYENSIYFNNSFFHYPNMSKDITSTYWKTFYSYSEIPGNRITAALIANELVNFGKVSQAWQKHYAYQKILKDGFFASLGNVYANNLSGIVDDKQFFDLPNYRFFVCPGIDINLHSLFDKEFCTKYPHLIKYNDHALNQSATVFFAEEYVDQSNYEIPLMNAKEICMLFGGGGHPGCGGFTLEKIDFKNVYYLKEIEIDDPNNYAILKIKALMEENAQNLIPLMSPMLNQYII